MASVAVLRFQIDNQQVAQVATDLENMWALNRRRHEGGRSLLQRLCVGSLSSTWRQFQGRAYHRCLPQAAPASLDRYLSTTLRALLLVMT
jgi:hypothetical protein